MFLCICWQITWQKWHKIWHADVSRLTLGRHRWALLSFHASFRPTFRGLGFGYFGQIAWKKWPTVWHAYISRYLGSAAIDAYNIIVRLSVRRAIWVWVCWGWGSGWGRVVITVVITGGRLLSSMGGYGVYLLPLPAGHSSCLYAPWLSFFADWGFADVMNVEYVQIILHIGIPFISVMAFQITGTSIVYSTVYSGADKRKHQSSASLALFCFATLQLCQTFTGEQWSMYYEYFKRNDHVICGSTVLI